MIRNLVKNYTKGRDGHRVRAVVLHITEGSASGTLAWFNNPRSLASAHYLIHPTQPYVSQLVEECDTAWHAGKLVRPTWPRLIEATKLGGIENIGTVDEDAQPLGEKGADYVRLHSEVLGGTGKTIVNPNKYTIGIEVALPNGRTMPTWGQWLAVTRLVRDIAGRYSLPLDKHGLVNHFEINKGKTCPGMWCRRFYILSLMKFINK